MAAGHSEGCGPGWMISCHLEWEQYICVTSLSICICEAGKNKSKLQAHLPQTFHNVL